MLDNSSFELLKNILFETYGVCFKYFDYANYNLKDLDLEIRYKLSNSNELYEKLNNTIKILEFGKIYVLLDNFHLYTILFVADENKKGFYEIGPFMMEKGALLYEQICKNNHLNIDPSGLELLMQDIPNSFSKDNGIIIAKNVLNIKEPILEDINLFDYAPVISFKEDINIKAQRIEQFWVHERHILKYIQQGNENKALEEGKFFLDSKMENRLENRFYSMRTLLYSVNTLFCRAAHEINVHPLFCDEISTNFAKKLESSISISQLSELYKEMIHEYCELCKNQSALGISSNVRKVMHYVQMNINQCLTPNSIAKNVGFSSAYLSRLFKEELGITLNQYINNQRMIVAKRLLRFTSMPIKEVAEHCGISDWNYFTKIFKDEVGVTPSLYRKDNFQNLD